MNRGCGQKRRRSGRDIGRGVMKRYQIIYADQGGKVRHKVGSRVGAILGSKEKVVDFLGYGVYEGDFDPDKPEDAPRAVGAIADMGRQAAVIAAENNIAYLRRNPKIRLDNGKIVWGCECWWGSEEEVKKQIEAYKGKGYTINEVDIDEIRKKYMGQ